MLATWFTKPFLAITVLLAIVVVGNIGYNYSILVEQDETGLVPLSLRDSPIVRFLARHTLRRKILSGAVSGTDALWLALLLTHSPFHTEAAFERADEILSYGVDIDSTLSSGDTLLIRSVTTNLPEVVIYLLERCADRNSGESAFLKLTNQEDAIEFAYFLEKQYPEKNYARVIAALENQKLAGQCDKPFGSAP